MPTRNPTLVFLHGVNNDDPDQALLAALDEALLRAGQEDIESRGWEVVAPRYLDLLGEAEPREVELEPTYRPAEDNMEAVAGYWARMQRFESSLRGSRTGSSPTPFKPPDGKAVDAMAKAKFAQADRYRKSEGRRKAIFTRILEALPAETDLVVIAHSLGSVIAADLVYFLPHRCRLQLLITAGSPLGLEPMQRHLERRRMPFPYGIAAPWINIVGTYDWVTGYRGLSQVVPQALDVWVDSGKSPAKAHSSTAYLRQDVVADALKWLDDELAGPGRAASKLLPDKPVSDALLAILVGAQYALRVGQTMEADDQRSRYSAARRLVMGLIEARLNEAAEHHALVGRLLLNNASALRGRASLEQVAEFLLMAHMENPCAPFEIEVEDDERLRALESLASDLGVPEALARCVVEAVDDARSAHKKAPWLKAVVLVGGITALVAMPALLVVAAAPTGLAGGAAVAGGLAALGPGGMLGGVTLIGLVGGAGGAGLARALASGTAAELAQRVIFLQAAARIRREFGLPDNGYAEWFALIALEDLLSDDFERHVQLSDRRSAARKEAERKLGAVRRALAWMDARRLAPAALMRA